MLTWTLLAAIAALIVIGFVSNVVEARAWVRDHNTLRQFQSWLIEYGNDGCQNREIMGRMIRESTKVEAALGVDNFVSGVVCFHMRLQGVPVIPFVIREIDQRAGEYFWQQDIGKALYLVDGALIRRMGRIDDLLDGLSKQRVNPFFLFIRGWKFLWSIPLYVLASFGLLGKRTVRSARESRSFQLLAFLSLIATIVGCVLAYLPNRPVIDREIAELLGD